MDTRGQGQELTLAGMVPGMIGIVFITGAVTALWTTVFWSGPVEWAALEPGLPEVLIGLLLIGALPALARGSWIGFAACAAGAAIGFALSAGVHVSFAGTYQGMTVVGDRDAFVTFAFLAIAGGFLAVSAGYAMATALLALLGRPSTRLPGWARRWPAVVLGAGATVLAMIAVSAALATALAGSDTFLEEEGGGGGLVHRITITENGITLDADTIEAGEVTWLANVEGDPPRDLTLIDERGRTLHMVGTPPAGSRDFLLMRMTMTPGRWLFTAGLPPEDPHPIEWKPPVGTLATWLEVVP